MLEHKHSHKHYVLTITHNEHTHTQREEWSKNAVGEKNWKTFLFTLHTLHFTYYITLATLFIVAISL